MSQFSILTLTSDSDATFNKRTASKSLNFVCLLVFGQWLIVYGRLKLVSDIKGYLETATERPTYLATSTSVHRRAISIFI